MKCYQSQSLEPFQSLIVIIFHQFFLFAWMDAFQEEEKRAFCLKSRAGININTPFQAQVFHTYINPG